MVEPNVIFNQEDANASNKMAIIHGVTQSEGGRMKKSSRLHRITMRIFKILKIKNLQTSSNKMITKLTKAQSYPTPFHFPPQTTVNQTWSQMMKNKLRNNNMAEAKE